MRRALRIALVATALLPPAAAARAETLILSLSSRRVQITQSYTGAELVIFGAIERDARSVARPGPFDIVVTVKGPRGQTVVREKTRFGPIWVNLEQRKFPLAPSTLSVLSSRDLVDIAPPEMQKRYGLGLANALGADNAEPRFREALIRLKREQGLYVENPRDVTFISGDIFRAPVPVADTAPVGTYEVTVSLMSGGLELTREKTSFEVSKAGFEQTLSTAARQHPWLYGSITAAIALAFGWLASVIFRRD
ncbi:TIGR02186 family protein [Alsobacter sp. SYSU M60028]|uniref:TIGR02186 family protein n=1 Tax=Alsobacter ponti TaxID=2962936 RepID=A0ABT1LES6_9HYPH|nr:TIGR02186 family protein [Alsobacter ponti]MCP8940002.1 TIGR02186 family protein [Alsobacter ponti]